MGKLGNLGPSALGSILTLVRRPIVIVVSATAVALGATVVMPVAGGAQEDPAGRPSRWRTTRPLVAVEVDILKADDRQVTQALGDIKANVDAQTAELTAAEQALASANAAVASADAAVADAQRQIDDLLAKTDHVVVDAFVTPGTESALSMLSEESPRSPT